MDRLSITSDNANSRAAIARSEPADFFVRGLEFHGNDRFQTGMWRWRTLDRAFRLMEQLELNTLIFHEVDLPDWLVLPRAYFSDEMMHSRWPVRRENVENARSHIREVARRAARQNVRFFLEVKEISYPIELTELYPGLMEIDGVVCPTHPFWWEYERAKYRELLEDIPDIAGVIVSPGTRESQLSFAAHACTCERCRSYSASDWYANILRAMHEPLDARGKLLVVRDFAYSRSEQNLIVNACSAVSKNIVVALKATPHDFYPTFPDNPRIGRTNGLPQWVEFDAWCQFSGMGLFPVSIVEDTQRRLRHAKDNGVTGVWFRVDLETVSDSSVFNSLNMVNLFGGGMLSRRIGLDVDSVYHAWLAYGLADPMKAESEQSDPMPVPPAEWERFRDFMRASWLVMEKTLYVRGFNFNDGSCQFPISVDRAFYNMLVLHGREDWEPGAGKRVAPTEENLPIIFAEKEQAEREVALLPGMLHLEQSTLPASLQSSLLTSLELYRLYVRGLRVCAVACFTAKKAMNTRDEADLAATKRAVIQLAAHRDAIALRLRDTTYPHYVYALLSVDRLGQLVADVRDKITAISPTA